MSLRDALEKLIQEWHGSEPTEALYDALSELLAAHPVEPAKAGKWEDELEPFIAEQMKNPAFKAAYEAEVARDSEPAPVASRDRVAEALRGKPIIRSADKPEGWRGGLSPEEIADITDALLAAGVFRQPQPVEPHRA